MWWHFLPFLYISASSTTPFLRLKNQNFKEYSRYRSSRNLSHGMMILSGFFSYFANTFKYIFCGFGSALSPKFVSFVLVLNIQLISVRTQLQFFFMPFALLCNNLHLPFYHNFFAISIRFKYPESYQYPVKSALTQLFQNIYEDVE